MGGFDSYPKVDFIEGMTAEKREAEMRVLPMCLELLEKKRQLSL